MTTAQALNDFFAKGLEGYDQKTKLVTNIGGAKLWWEAGWKKMEKIFIAEPLFNVLKNLPVSLYVMSAARIGEDGRAVRLPNGNGVQRDSLGLMLYSQFNMTDKAAKQFRDLIVQAIPMLEGYVVVGTEVLAEAPNIKNVTKMTFRNGQRDEPLRLEGCIFINAPSGSEMSSQLWGFRSKSATKAAMATRTTETNAEVPDFT